MSNNLNNILRKLVNKLEKKAALPDTSVSPLKDKDEKPNVPHSDYTAFTGAQLSEVEEDDVSNSPEVLLASTKKLLGVSRNEISSDNRDSIRFRKVYPVDKLIRERIRLDHGKTMRNQMRKLSRNKTLKNMPVGALDHYFEGMIVSNQLSMPGEEINPISLVEQARRITQMGEGGIGSSDSITPEMNAVDPTSFGFISVVEGPESEKIGIDTRAAWGTKIGSDGLIYQKFYNPKMKRYEWLNPTQLNEKVIGFPE